MKICLNFVLVFLVLFQSMHVSASTLTKLEISQSQDYAFNLSIKGNQIREGDILIILNQGLENEVRISSVLTNGFYKVSRKDIEYDLTHLTLIVDKYLIYDNEEIENFYVNKEIDLLSYSLANEVEKINLTNGAEEVTLTSDIESKGEAKEEEDIILSEAGDKPFKPLISLMCVFILIYLIAILRVFHKGVEK